MVVFSKLRKIIDYEGLYLLIKTEFHTTNQNIYKIGRSNNLSQRVYRYSDKSHLYLLILCQNSMIHEQNLINIFRDTFHLEKTYGSEYFSGDINSMIKIMEDYCKSNILDNRIIKFDDIFILDKSNKILQDYIMQKNSEFLNIKDENAEIITEGNQNEDDNIILKQPQNVGVVERKEQNKDGNIEENEQDIDSNKLFRCKCGNKYKHNYLLQNHINSIRGCAYIRSIKNEEGQEKDDEKTIKNEVKCTVCEKIISNKYNLGRHSLTCKGANNSENNNKSTSNIDPKNNKNKTNGKIIRSKTFLEFLLNDLIKDHDIETQKKIINNLCKILLYAKEVSLEKVIEICYDYIDQLNQ